MASPIVWASLDNCTDSGGTLTKTGGGAADDAGAISSQQLIGDGYVEWTATETNTWRMLGFKDSVSASYADIPFGIMLLNNGLFNVIETNSFVSSGNAYSAGDVLKIEIASGVVTYLQNGTLIYTSLIAATFPLYAVARMGGPASTLTDCGIYGVQVSVSFSDASTSDVTSWAWDFGDGSTSTDQNPTHTFLADGAYTVTLTVTSARGTVSTSKILTFTGGVLASTTVVSIGETPGANPQVMLRISNDGGKTWAAETWRSAGRVGEYLARVDWNRLGCARRRVFEVSCSDPVPFRIVGAYLTLGGQDGR